MFEELAIKQPNVSIIKKEVMSLENIFRRPNPDRIYPHEMISNSFQKGGIE